MGVSVAGCLDGLQATVSNIPKIMKTCAPRVIATLLFALDGTPEYVWQAGTFNGFKGDRAGDKIDYILCPADAAVLDARILHDHRGDTYLSDHYPVTAAVRLP